MMLTVKKVEELDYALVTSIYAEGENSRVKIEIPRRVLEEVGWRPSEGDVLEVALLEKAEPEEWQIVMSGKPLKTGKNRVVYSFGGLICAVEGPGLRALDPAYLHLRVRPGR